MKRRYKYNPASGKVEEILPKRDIIGLVELPPMNNRIWKLLKHVIFGTPMPHLDDQSPMPFGKHKGSKMENVPADYLCWVWSQRKSSGGVETELVQDYIRRNLAALAKEHPDGIWE